MKRYVLSAALLSSLAPAAWAHVEPGPWTGTTPAGAACSLVAGPAYFENQVPHPLNERVPIETGGARFVVGHPPVIDVAKPLAFFNHGVLQSVLPTAAGAKALVIDMVHTAAFEGPTGYHVIDHDWRTGSATRLDCLNLKHLR